MTGYGKATATIGHRKVTVEVKSLNSKQLDLSMKVVPQFREREMDMRRLVTAAMQRGKVDLVVTVEGGVSDETPQIDVEVMRSYSDQIRSAAGALGLACDEGALLPALLRLPDVVHVAAAETSDAELDAVVALVGKAVDALVAFRRQEGEMLYGVFSEKLRNIRSLLDSVEPYEKERTESVRRHLLEQLEALPVAYDKNRLEQELIYYIEKLDINEEKHRLDNHLKYFQETMDADDLGAGKKLGFIAQEMGREINTLGSKSNQAEMQRIVVRMKDELEQIKEQVLNVL